MTTMAALQAFRWVVDMGRSSRPFVVAECPHVQPTSAAEELSLVMARVADGDHAAFATFYDATSRTVFGIVLRVLRDRAQAEEVAQEVFLEAWKTSTRYDARQGTPAAWINTIAHRQSGIGTASAPSSVRPSATGATLRTGHGADDGLDVSLTSWSPRDEGGRGLRRALAQLPEEAQRVALALAYFEGRTQREVAEMLDVPLGTVKTRMRDAMKKLRTHLDEGVT